MDKIQKSILDITNNFYEYLISLENVHGIGLGYKYINNIDTKEPCIHVLVDKKVDNKYLSPNNIIPKTYMGIKTDVIKSQKAFAKLSNYPIPKIPQMVRPLEGGTGISINTVDSDGTLGCIVTKKSLFKREYFILTNNHTLIGENGTPIGTPVIQPSVETGGSQKYDAVAYLSNFIPIKFANSKKIPNNYVDCAIAKIKNPYFLSTKVYQVGKINGVNTANLGLNVKKVGFVSGKTSGNVISIGTSIDVEFPNGKKAFFKNLIKANLTNYSGDSGSVVLNDNNEVVGLLFAGIGDDIALMNDINIVLKKLNIQIYI